VSTVGAPIALSVRRLEVSLRLDHGFEPVVRGVGFDLRAGEILALVGESGCGKSKTAEALMGLLPLASGTVSAERMMLGGIDLLALDESNMRRIRGREMSMVFQEPRTALDPVFTCGSQLAGVFRRHRGDDRSRARQSAAEMMSRVGFPDSEYALERYPHELSGGQRQRVIIAMAMACRPRVLIADEPTTALDVTTQAQVLDRMVRLTQEAGTALLLITHDLGVVAQYCDRALVMRGGLLLEDSPVETIFGQPAHEYTRALLAASSGLFP
jgi:peptide/nickel transport system ATP-binding protein